MYRTKNFILSIFTAVVLAGIFTGCSSKHVSIIGDERVEVLEHRTIEEGNFIKAVIDLENEDDDNVEGFVYRIEWYDKYDVLKETTAWKPITIHKNQRVQIVEMSTMPEVTTYKIVISVPEKIQ